MKIFFLSFNGFYTKFYFNKFFINYFYNYKLILDLFNYYNSNKRLSNSSQKNRSLVKHSTRKIYKQKGLGKSRVGSISSPIRRGGGVCFPNFQYQNYSLKINKFLYKISFFFIYSQIFFENKLLIIDDFFFIFSKTKFFLNRLKKMFLFNFVLFCNSLNINFFKCCKNIYSIKIFNFLNFNPNIFFKFDKILLTKSFLKFLEKKLL